MGRPNGGTAMPSARPPNPSLKLTAGPSTPASSGAAVCAPSHGAAAGRSGPQCPPGGGALRRWLSLLERGVAETAPWWANVRVGEHWGPQVAHILHHAAPLAALAGTAGRRAWAVCGEL